VIAYIFEKRETKVLGTFGQLFDGFGVERGVCGIIKKMLSVLE